MTLDMFNLTAAIVSIVAFLFAIWEHLRHRTEKLRDEERFRAQEEKNRSAIRVAVVGAQSADQIVQRAKDADSTTAELQSMARTTRAILLYLASELEDQATVIASWKFGQSLMSSGGADSSPRRTKIKFSRSKNTEAPQDTPSSTDEGAEDVHETHKV